MKKFKFFGLLLTLVVAIGCGTKKNSATTTDNSMTSLDWDGKYIFDGNTEAPAIQISLTKKGEFNAVIMDNQNNADNKYVKGTFVWDKAGKSIILDQPIAETGIKQFFVGENKITAVDGVVGKIECKKMQENSELIEKYWKLIAVNDIKITNKDFIETEPHIMFKSEFNHVRGNDGCNQFQGNFEINGNKITFGRMLSTLKACPDVFASTEFRKLLSEEITFEVKNDKLTLKTNNDTFQFEAVYF